jgi:hypothetical protein
MGRPTSVIQLQMKKDVSARAVMKNRKLLSAHA